MTDHRYIVADRHRAGWIVTLNTRDADMATAFARDIPAGVAECALLRVPEYMGALPVCSTVTHAAVRAYRITETETSQ